MVFSLILSVHGHLNSIEFVLQWCCESSVFISVCTSCLFTLCSMAIGRQVHPSGFYHLKSLLRIGGWNVCSLVEADDVKIATV